MHKKLIVLIILISSSLMIVFPQGDPTFTVGKTIDWSKGILRLKIIKENDLPARFTPDYKYLVEREIRDQLPDIFLDSILDIYINSRHTIGDMVIEKDREIQLLKTLYINGKNEGAYQSQDFKQTFINYSFPFFSDKGFIPLFIHHEYPVSLAREIGFIPTKEYTGLIIYARGSFRSYGTNTDAYAEPSLFPVFYDEQTNPILDKWMCDPEYLKNWGMAAYSETNDENEFLHRVGLFPLRTMAHQVFGKHHSDIILPNEVVRKLLSSEMNRKMLQQGKILIIIEPEEVRKKSPALISGQ